MNKVEQIGRLKERYKIESVENALIFVQAVIREVAFQKMKEVPTAFAAEATRKYNDCAETLDGIKNTMKAWGIK